MTSRLRHKQANAKLQNSTKVYAKVAIGHKHSLKPYTSPFVYNFMNPFQNYQHNNYYNAQMSKLMGREMYVNMYSQT